MQVFLFLASLLIPSMPLKGSSPPKKKREAGRWVGVCTLYLLCLALEKRGERVSGGIRYSISEEEKEKKVSILRTLFSLAKNKAREKKLQQEDMYFENPLQKNMNS